MPLDAKSLTLRQKMLETLYRGGRGHLPSAFSCAEIVRVLYDSILNINPTAPDDPNRDRFILSKGHACLALYVMLAEKGFFPEEELWRFCRFGSPLGGHPERAA
jgi:transketolase